MLSSFCRSHRSFPALANFFRLPTALAALLLLGSAGAQVGTLDPDFGDAGVVVIDVANEDFLTDLAVTSNRRILAVGRTGPGSINSQDALLSRLEPDGTSTTSWPIQTGGTSVPEEFHAVSVAAEGSLITFGWGQYGGGANDRDLWLRRTTQNGQSSGSFQRPNQGFARRFESYGGMIQSDGKFVAVGWGLRLGDSSSFDAVIARWLANGDMDSNFGGFTDQAQNLVALPDTRRIAVARLLSNGDPDPGFSGTGTTIVDTGFEVEERGAAIVLQPGKGIVIAANRFADGSSDGLVIRLLNGPDQLFADRFEQEQR